MTTGMDKKRLSIFLALAFGIAWLTALIIFLTGGLTDSPQITPGLPLAVVLLAGVYMWAPAIASLLTRMITREGWRDSMLRANLKRGWPFWLAAWVMPAVLTIIGLAVYFLVFPHLYDPDFSFIRLNYTGGCIGSLGVNCCPNPAGHHHFSIDQWLFYIWRRARLARILAAKVNAVGRTQGGVGVRCYLGRLALAIDCNGT
jgi:hypothetical protein